ATPEAPLQPGAGVLPGAADARGGSGGAACRAAGAHPLVPHLAGRARGPVITRPPGSLTRGRPAERAMRRRTVWDFLLIGVRGAQALRPRLSAASSPPTSSVGNKANPSRDGDAKPGISPQ